MATLKFTKLADDDDFLFFHLDDNPYHLAAHSVKQARFDSDEQVGAVIIVRGKDLHYTAGHLDGGIVTSVSAYNFQGHEYATVAGTHFKIGQVDTNPLSVLDLYVSAMRGNDKVVGTAADDFLFGLGGKDTLIGGKGDDKLWGDVGNDTYDGGAGSDLFYAYISTGHDVILDFDATGGVGHQDHISTGTNDYFLKSVNHGKDTLVLFGETAAEGSVLLKNIKIGQIDDTDFEFLVL